MANKMKAKKKAVKKPTKLKKITSPPFIEKTGIYDRSTGHLEKLEAVKQGVFTSHEMLGVLNCYRDDCALMFIILDEWTNSNEERVDRLMEFKTHFQLRFDMNPDKGLYQHQHRKLMKFIDNRYWEEQKLALLNSQTNSKTAKENKDILLNQEQQVILFQYLQRINIFDATQKLNTKMATAINVLTGWDKDKTRQLFSSTADIIHKGKVIQAVKQLLTELDKEK